VRELPIHFCKSFIYLNVSTIRSTAFMRFFARPGDVPKPSSLSACLFPLVRSVILPVVPFPCGEVCANWSHLNQGVAQVFQAFFSTQLLSYTTESDHGLKISNSRSSLNTERYRVLPRRNSYAGACVCEPLVADTILTAVSLSFGI
jgi:hypothetical protein